ncbi:hypothetical protein ALO_01195 [Acetonema longum DSM 6540]|uniref:Uncharacterized protein n=1 Tax=Acetonema longum DSM 6540 TaxID=1009370 RepID=F7NDX7_9FIRM|nr:hypothetical protein ALO_01195 [Acetonema longum DSM 6540]
MPAVAVMRDFYKKGKNRRPPVKMFGSMSNILMEKDKIIRKCD